MKSPKSKPQFGLGFRRVFSDDIFNKKSKIDFLEIVSENYFYPGGQSRALLLKLRDKYPLAIHGVSLSIASTHDPTSEYLEKLKALICEIDPFLVTDHLCVTQSVGRELHDLLPISLNEKTLDLVCKRVEFVQKYLGRTISLENPSQYLLPKYGTLTLADFYNKLFNRTGCGLLLDLNNLWVNEVNLGLSSDEFLNEIDPKMVAQKHIAGASSSEGGFLIDTHDNPMSERSWEIYRKSCVLFSGVPTLLEWDDKIPAFENLLGELDKARKISKQLSTKHLIEKQPVQQKAEFGSVSTDLPYVHELYVEEFGDLLYEKNGVSREDPRLERHFEEIQNYAPREWGARVYLQAFYLRHKEQLESVFPIFHSTIGHDLWEQIVADYLTKMPPQHFSIDETGSRFGIYAKNNLEPWLDQSDGEYPTAFYNDIIEYELARFELLGVADDQRLSHTLIKMQSLAPEQWESLEISFASDMKIVPTRTQLSVYLNAYYDKKLPLENNSDLLLQTETIGVFRNTSKRIEYYVLTGFERALIEKLAQPQTLGDLGEWVSGPDEHALTRVFEALIPWVQRGYIKVSDSQKHLYVKKKSVPKLRTSEKSKK